MNIGIQNVVNYKGLWIPIHDIECLIGVSNKGTKCLLNGILAE